MRTELYRLYDTDGTLVYVGIARDPRARIAQHRGKDWFWYVARYEATWFESRSAATEAETWAIDHLAPLANRTQMDEPEVTWAGPPLTVDDAGAVTHHRWNGSALVAVPPLPPSHRPVEAAAHAVRDQEAADHLAALIAPAVPDPPPLLAAPRREG
jgi:hypothetical protein